MLIRRIAERVCLLGVMLASMPAIARADAVPSLPAALEAASRSSRFPTVETGRVDADRASVAVGEDRLTALNLRLGLELRFGLQTEYPSLPSPEPIAPTSTRSVPGNGGSLFIVALVGLGTIGGARSSRRLGLAWAPEWVHTGGPEQIGHSTVFDLSGDFEPFVVRPYELPSQARHWFATVIRVFFAHQCPVPQAAPRGPPCRA